MSDEPNRILTDNDFLVGATGTELVPLIHPQITNREQAFRTAAWIEVMGQMLPRDPDHPEVTYEEVREAIMNT